MGKAYENRNELIAAVTKPGSTYDRWAWTRMLDMLDAAGYFVCKKPELIDRGLPTRNGNHGG